MKSLMLWAFLACLCPSLVHATTYYFSTSGNDSYSSTQATNPSTPWKSIDKLNTIFSTLQPGDVVLFKKGETFYGTIKPTKSGTAAAPITIGAYGSGNNPVITGFVTLSNWTSIGSGRYESTDASLGASVAMVTMNGAAQELGRYPNSDATNEGYLNFESHGTNSITDNELTSSTNWAGAEVVIRSSHWSLDRLSITAHSGGTITYSPAASYTLKDGYGYFIQNDVRTLDKQGEWAYKASTKKLTVHFGSSTPSSYQVKASVLNNQVYISGYNYITLSNLTFEGANDDALYIKSSTGTQVLNCNILNSGNNGIEASSTNGLMVDNSTISNSNNIGIYLVSSTNNSIISNNTVKNSGKFAGMGYNGANTSVGMRINGDKNLVQYNTIDSSGYCGIRFAGDYTEIKNNFITNFCFVKDDGAGVYTGAPDKVERVGRKITGNIILNGIGAKEGTTDKTTLQASGIYLDNYSAGIDIQGNTVANCGKVGIYVHNAYKLNIRDNTSFDNNSGQLQFTFDNGGARITQVNMKDNVYVSKTKTQTVGYFYTYLGSSDINSFGTIDSNYYARPIDDNTTIRTATGLYTSTQVLSTLALSGWQSAYVHDDRSNKAPKTLSSTVDPNDYLRLEFNASNTSKTIALDATYIDMKNKTYSGTITLAPYTSVVLLKTGAAPNQAPSVSLTSPTANAIFTAPAGVKLTATATDTDGTISKVEFYNGSTLLQTVNAAPYDWTWTSVAAGTYSITAKAYDNTGNITTSTPVSITVKPNQAPTVSLTSPTANAIYTAPADVKLTANASDTDGTISKVEFYAGATLLQTVSAAPYDWTWSYAAAGTYSITAKAYDNTGNVTTSAPVTITVNPNQAPSAALTSPSANATYTAPGSVRLTATATDVDGSISKVEFYNGSTLLQTVSAAPYDWTWTSVAAGTYTITAKAYDNTGNITTTAPVSITVNPNQAPSVSLTSPTASATYTAPASVHLTATATDVDGTISKVEFYAGATLLQTVSTAPYDWTWSYAAAGTYTITAKAYDNNGNVTTSAPVTITVNPSQAPSVSLTSPTANATYTAPGSVRLTATATDVDGSISKVEFYNGSTLLQTVSAAPYDWTWTSVAAGTYTITAKAYDNSGNVSTSAPVTITVKANQAPTVTITSPKANATYSAPASVRLTATATDVDGTISKVEFYKGSTLIQTEKAAPYDWTWNNVAAGTYTITAKAYDNSGNVTVSAPVTITVKKGGNLGMAMPTDNNMEMSSSTSLRLYPNPATSTINVDLNGLANNQPAKLTIYNMAGSIVKSMPVTLSGNNIKVDISTLAHGMYLLKIAGEGIDSTQKFQKID
ncbi:Ig-like domain-containing protein [Chitinophagaceae bacterium LB-8]|uniref:Ig-like domain-containing protein n=1 Tax=Paraflavisolibacter caeni TaxID=2982496 RepID=A0A9X2XP76_9BACT|nr:Ig-like domain-containing protein [Paraflavisolibacter caeni]MCU7550618.1 Ig-like domain-containing protein [Paraflavisolibacter caeni]